MIDERIEIAVAVQQGNPIDDTPRRDQRVDRLADRYPTVAQAAVIARGFGGDAVVGYGKLVESRKFGGDKVMRPIGSYPLQDLDQHKIADDRKLS